MTQENDLTLSERLELIECCIGINQEAILEILSEVEKLKEIDENDTGK